MLISKLQYITDNPQDITPASRGGVAWVQLRIKNASPDTWLAMAKQAQVICKANGVKLIINDNVELAKQIAADGMHLGKEDMPVKDARKILGPDFIIGGTANTISDVRKLAEEGANYIGLGPFRFTETKKNLSPVLGLHGYTEIMRACAIEGIAIPIIAIGGIKAENIDDLLQTGVYGIAVSSAISKAVDVETAAKIFVQSLKFQPHEK